MGKTHKHVGRLRGATAQYMADTAMAPYLNVKMCGMVQPLLLLIPAHEGVTHMAGGPARGGVAGVHKREDPLWGYGPYRNHQPPRRALLRTSKHVTLQPTWSIMGRVMLASRWRAERREKYTSLSRSDFVRITAQTGQHTTPVSRTHRVPRAHTHSPLVLAHSYSGKRNAPLTPSTEPARSR